MTQPPYDTGPGSTPPGFGPPGQTPWRDGKPLAAANTVSRKRFLAVMAFFGALLLVSVAGFVLTTGGDRSEQATAPGGGEVTLAPRPTRTPRETVLREPKRPGPVPKPVVYRGSGTKVVRIRRPEPGDALVYVKAAPPANGFLSVMGLDAKGTQNGFVIASTEAYEGVRVLDITSLTRTTSLEIEAGGPWVVEVRSARSAKAFGRSISGRGDSVLRYTGRRGTATIRGGAPMKPFTVLTHVDGFPRLVATALGTFDGEKSWPAGPVLVEVQTPGRWSIRVT